jgi:hypothetical protein
VALWLVLDDESIAFSSGELGGAGLFCIKMIETRLPRNKLSVFGNL